MIRHRTEPRLRDRLARNPAVGAALVIVVGLGTLGAAEVICVLLGFGGIGK